MNVQRRVRPVASPGDGPAHAIAGIFTGELQVPSVGLDDNFFDLGGDSLMAETLVLAVQKRFGVKLQTSVLLEAQTPREFGRLIASLVPVHPARELIMSVAGSIGHEPIAMIHGINGSALFANRFSRQLKEKYAIMAVRGMGTEPGETPYSALAEICSSYFEALTSVTGQHPDVIGGICVGGLLAIEVGRLSHETTGKRPAIILIDPPSPGSAWLKPMPDDRLTESRRRQIAGKVIYWRLLRDAMGTMGLGQTRLGRHLRKKAYKSTLLQATAGFVPSSYPCDVLILASSEWGATTVKDYKGWASDKASVKTVVMPGTHSKFRKANMDAIDAEILAFLAERPGATKVQHQQ